MTDDESETAVSDQRRWGFDPALAGQLTNLFLLAALLVAEFRQTGRGHDGRR
jgi:hypothetical protein